MSEAAQSTDPLDCTACGACCRYAGEVVVAPTDNVPKHLTRSVPKLVNFAPANEQTVLMARAPDGRCIALSGELGSACRCTIYDRRPAVCRAFEAGSAACRGSRGALFG